MNRAARRLPLAILSIMLALVALCIAAVPAHAEDIAQATETSASSWRYEDGKLVENPDTDGETLLSLLGSSTTTTSTYSAWTASNGTTSYEIVTETTESGTTTVTASETVAVSGVVRVVIDVSKWQGEIDWEAVAASGVTAAIIRCGYGSDYESQDDAYFLQNVEGALENGIQIGVYLYSYATKVSGSDGSASSEASHVLRLLEEAGLDPEDLDLGVFLDMEDSTQAALSASTLGDIAETFCDAIQAEGYAVGIYANKNWWENYLTDEAFEDETWYKWVARYPISSSVTSCGVDDADLWQFSQAATVDGIDGAVDVSFDYVGTGGYVYEAPEVKVAPAAVSLNSATLSSSLTSCTLKWTAVSGVTGYEIYRSVDGGSYSKVKTITSSSTVSYTNSSLTLGKTYRYKIRAYTTYSDGTKLYGSYSSVKSVTTKPSTVTISSAATTTKGYVKVSWKKTSNATGYVIYRSVNGGSYSTVKTISSNSTVSWTDSSVTAGKTYRYKIKAYTKSGSTTAYSSSYSDVKKVVAVPAQVSITSITSTASRSGTVKWGKVSGATGYQVAYRIKGTSKWYYVTVTSNSKKFTSLRNKNYYVKVRAYKTVSGTKYYGAWSSEKLMTVK